MVYATFPREALNYQIAADHALFDAQYPKPGIGISARYWIAFMLISLGMWYVIIQAAFRVVEQVGPLFSV